MVLLLYFGINYRFLKSWFGDVQFQVRIFPSELAAWLSNSLSENRLLAALLAILFGLHIYPMTRPIAFGGDEAYHAWYVLGLVERASTLLAGVLGISFLSVLRILLSVFLIGLILIDIGRRKGRFLLAVRLSSFRPHLFGIFVSAIVVILYFALLRNQSYADALHRYPPLGKIALLLSHTLFGVNEFAARFPSVVFSFLSGIYVLKTINLYYGRERGMVGFCLLLFMPGFFYYSNFAYLEMGVIFFICATGFYFLRHLEQKEGKDYLLAMLFLSLGFLYKQYTIGLLPIYAAYVLFLYYCGGRTAALGLYLKATWISVATILPWTVVQGVYGFYPSNWLSMEIITRSLRNMPTQVTYPMCALFITGLGWGMLRREKVIIYSGITFAAFYIYMNSLREEIWVGYPRFMTVLFPPMAIISAVFLGMVLDILFQTFLRPFVEQHTHNAIRMSNSRRGAYRKWETALYALVILYLIAQSPFNPSNSSMKYGQEYFVELDEVFQYIKEKIPAKSRWVSVSHYSPIAFYKYKYQIDMDIIGDPGSQLQLSRLGEFIKWMKEKQVSYVLVILPVNLERGESNQWAASRRLEEEFAGEKHLLFQLYDISTGIELALVQEFHKEGGKVKIFKLLEKLEGPMEGGRKEEA